MTDKDLLYTLVAAALTKEADAPWYGQLAGAGLGALGGFGLGGAPGAILGGVAGHAAANKFWPGGHALTPVTNAVNKTMVAPGQTPSAPPPAIR